MSLIKAIKSGKEHRKEYRGGKAVSRSCRNHGGRYHGWECEYCKGNRLYQSKKVDEKYREEMKNKDELR